MTDPTQEMDACPYCGGRDFTPRVDNSAYGFPPVAYQVCQRCRAESGHRVLEHSPENTPPECSICRRRHGLEIVHACE